MPFCRVYKRMMGREPTTFCMASASDVRARSSPFARDRLFPGSSCGRANATAPERTPSLAILATRLGSPAAAASAHPGREPQAATSWSGQVSLLWPANSRIVWIGYAASGRVVPCSRRASASACALTGPTPLTSAYASGPAARSRSTLPNRSSSAHAVASEIPGMPLSTYEPAGGTRRCSLGVDARRRRSWRTASRCNH